MESKPKETVEVTITAPDPSDLSDMRDFINKQLVAWAGITDEGKLVILDPKKGFRDGRSFCAASGVGEVKMVAALYLKGDEPHVGFFEDPEDEQIRQALGTYWLILQGHVEVPS